MGSGTKICKGECGKLKPLEEFPRDPRRKDGRYPYCKPCKSAYMRDYNRRNRSRTRLIDFKRNLKRRYGIDWNEYQRLLKEQKGKCAICKTPPPRDRLLCVDHCHKTGKVRGLLCGPCNLGLGSFKDDRRRLRAALSYLN